MDKRIKEIFNDSILQEAMRRYGIGDDQIRPLDAFESFIYEFERVRERYILRIGHSYRRSVALIQGEVDWINYLARGGASVATAIPSENGALVEPLDDGVGGQFLATAFVKAKGGPPGKADFTPGLFETWGRILGKMHALTKRYQPANPAWRRPDWDDGRLLGVEAHLPPSEATAVEMFQAVVQHLVALPKDKNSYGLVHRDAHGANLFLDGRGRITLFDFDDCGYSWFIDDISIVLFYAAMWEKDAGAFTRSFMTHFLRGYRREEEIDPWWFEQMPYFLKLREIDVYAVIHRSRDVKNIEDPWDAGYMRDRKYRIENDVPYIDFDFASLGT